MKNVWSAVLPVAVLALGALGAPAAHAQSVDSDSSHTLDVNLPTYAKLTIGGLANGNKVEFNAAGAADALYSDSGVTSADSAISLMVEARASVGGSVVLTVDTESANLAGPNGASIPWTAVSWALGGTSGDGWTSATTFSEDRATLLNGTDSGQRTASLLYKIANSKSYAAGQYSGTVSYTLTVQ